MPERAYFPMLLSARDLLNLHGALAGLTPAVIRQRSEQLLNDMDLSAAANNPLSTYSKGMLQRAGLAQALMSDPDILVLDEPMSGLDPLGRKAMRDAMVNLRAAGKTIFFSTHILPDVEMICDRVAIV